MSFYDAGSSYGDSTVIDVGPQTDGTTLYSPIASTIPQPAETAGGAPADYGQSVLDVFKYGVGVWQQQNAQNAFFDYKRFEATNGGVYRQGAAATMPKAATGANNSGLMMMGLGLIVVFALLTHKG